MGVKKRVGFYCKKELHEEIKKLSEESGVPISKIIEKALNHYLGDESENGKNNQEEKRK